MNGNAAPIRALVIDDSLTARQLLTSVLQLADGIVVVGSGETGAEALRLTRRMKPDVLVMDVTMPGMDGLEATRQVMAEQPTPIVLVTGTLMRADVDLSFEALRAGALTVIAKPGMADEAACRQLVETVRSMAQVPVVRRWSQARSSARAETPGTTPISQPPVRPSDAALHLPLDAATLKGRIVVGIASSTGGPGTLARIFRALSSDFPLPILLVQHVTPGFGAGFAEWLDGETPLAVKLASHGEALRPGTVLVAPDDYHMQVAPRGAVELLKAPPYHGLRPSANYLFHALAAVYGTRAVGVVLTGMGDDGAEGLEMLRRSGGLVLAQDRASCIVYGMPGAAVERNAVDAILSVEEIASALGALTKFHTPMRSNF